MENNNPPSFFEKAGNWLRNSITLRLFTIGILILILLIPVSMIENLIAERESRQKDAQSEISDKWGHAQTVKGLVLSVPYEVNDKVYDKNEPSSYKVIQETRFMHFLPEKLIIKSELNPQVRYRGIFEAVIYSSRIELSGKFDLPEINDMEIREKLKWNEAFVSLGISDLRSIREEVRMKWNKQECIFDPGIPTQDVIASGISVKVQVQKPVKDSAVSYDFQLTLNLNGSNSMQFVPLGKSTGVDMSSIWKNPSFDGAFLPTERTVDEKGFAAKWNVLNLNRNYPQQFSGSVPGMDESAFGVSLLMPVDQYQKSMRAVKYAILFITLTFLVFFFMQVMNKTRIHPIQYILVGLGLCMFYTLLISLSEHILFGLAYLIASIAIIGLTTFYAQGTFRNFKLSAMLAAIMGVIYLFIYVIIQLEDYALLAGSIGLFIALSIIMILTRRIDWYNPGQFVKKS